MRRFAINSALPLATRRENGGPIPCGSDPLSSFFFDKENCGVRVSEQDHSHRSFVFVTVGSASCVALASDTQGSRRYRIPIITPAPNATSGRPRATTATQASEGSVRNIGSIK